MIHRAARFYLFTNRSDNFLPETQLKCEKIELLLTTSRLKDTGHLTVDQQATKKLKKTAVSFSGLRPHRLLLLPSSCSAESW